MLHTCASDVTVAAAKERLTRLRINAMPIEAAGELVGVVTRQILDNAIAGGLAERPVTTVMLPGVPQVAASVPVEVVERALIDSHARFVVVIDRARDHHAHGPAPPPLRAADRGRGERRPPGRRGAARRPQRRPAVARAHPANYSVSCVVGETADRQDRAYLVGAVRDVMLGRPLGGSTRGRERPELAREVVARCGGRAAATSPRW
jgi:CBS domain-containing protein